MDVYTFMERTGLQDADLGTRSFRLNLTVEPCPTALSRVFGLVGTLSLVPSVSKSAMGPDNLIDILLEFPQADARTLDLLRRKLEQLTETVSVALLAE